MARVPLVPFVIFLVLVVVITGYAISVFGIPGLREQNITPLAAVEIREYEGERLSSIADFRENSIRGPQYISPDTYRLNVTGLVDQPLSLSYDQVIERYPHYAKRVTLFCVEGWDVTLLWEGVLVEDLLADAKARPEADTVIFYAADGYSTSLPLDDIRDRDIMMAYAMNGVTLPPERGFPFQLVAEDRWGYKWIKWVTAIEVSADPSYRGYWESRGFSQEATINRRFFE
ncbi:MAG: molybdopterin-dependent oxidoreductase [Methanomicrobiales archaeon]|nr:molybdopterin-dependent oxidoreductase [Methanomicrobiales archaeon]NYT21322.1 molybdopterin-dependent oxidoreductase [Methanomicrobiales archaeon]